MDGWERSMSEKSFRPNQKRVRDLDSYQVDISTTYSNEMMLCLGVSLILRAGVQLSRNMLAKLHFK